MEPRSVEWASSVAAASRSILKVPLPRWRMPLGVASPEMTVTKADPGFDFDCASRFQWNDSSAFFETVRRYVLGSSAFDPGPHVHESSVQVVAGRLVTASTMPSVQRVAPLTETTNLTVVLYQSELLVPRSCCNCPDAPLEGCESLGLPMCTELLLGIASRA